MSPTSLGGASGGHEHRCAVEPCARDRADAVGDAGPRGQRGDTYPAGDLGPALRSERGGLFVARVDESDVLAHATVIERPEMGAVEREDGVHIVCAQCPRRENARVERRRLQRRRRRAVHGVTSARSTSARHRPSRWRARNPGTLSWSLLVSSQAVKPMMRSAGTSPPESFGPWNDEILREYAVASRDPRASRS